MAKWTQDKIPDQSGKLVLITGANTGLGLGTAKVLAQKNAQLVLAVRNLDKGQAAAAEIKAASPQAQVAVMQLDLADLDQVRDFTQAFQEQYSQLDVLINNAGVMMPAQRELSKQGFEIQLATNHLGHFVLTKGLLPLLQAAPAARVVTLSSLVAKMTQADIYFDDLQFAQHYRPLASYAQSKLANIMFAVDLQNKLAEQTTKVISVGAHPGYTATDLQRHMGKFGAVLNALAAQKVSMGILPTLMAATDPGVSGGDYYGPLKFGGYRGYPGLNSLPKKARSPATRQRLWQLTESLTQESFTL